MGFLRKIFDANRPQTRVVVSGLPRSGTSMMMKMLEAGGLPALTDNVRAADDSNPKGYYEFERVKRLQNGDTKWLIEAENRAVKVISALLQHLPADYHYQVVFVQRQIAEVLASQKKMLVQRGEDTKGVDDGQMAALFEKHVEQIRDWLAAQANFDVIYVKHDDVLTGPAREAQRITDFLGRDLDVAAMAQVVDTALYRNRAGRLGAVQTS